MFTNNRKRLSNFGLGKSKPELGVTCISFTQIHEHRPNYGGPIPDHTSKPPDHTCEPSESVLVQTPEQSVSIPDPTPRPIYDSHLNVDNFKGNERAILDELQKLEIRRRSSQQRDKFFKDELEKAQEAFEHRWHNQLSITSSTKLENLSKVVTLGCGTFGTVLLMHNNKDGKFYAVKYLKKQHVVAKKQVQNTLNEKKLLYAINHPFLVSLQFHFKDYCNLYMGMNFVEGGDMFLHLMKARTFSIKQCKFYAAQVVLALEYLHSNNVIYRDLKLENIMIAANGYIKLTDFGLAKRTEKKERTYTICGTPEYIAPEILLGKGYNQSVDWWALGIFIYEMMAGTTPFHDKDQMKIYKNILQKEVSYPKTFGDNVKDLLNNLLNRDFTKRYDASTIKNHRWFKNMQFVRLYKRELPAPFIPRLNGPTDTRYYDKWEEKPIPQSSQNLFDVEFKDF